MGLWVCIFCIFSTFKPDCIQTRLYKSRYMYLVGTYSSSLVANPDPHYSSMNFEWLYAIDLWLMLLYNQFCVALPMCGSNGQNNESTVQLFLIPAQSPLPSFWSLLVCASCHITVECEGLFTKVHKYRHRLSTINLPWNCKRASHILLYLGRRDYALSMNGSHVNQEQGVTCQHLCLPVCWVWFLRIRREDLKL